MYFDNQGDQFSLAVPLPSLVGYAGSAVCCLSLNCDVGGTSVETGIFFLTASGPAGVGGFDLAQAGTLSLPSATTPEPSTLALLLSGGIGAAGVIRRRLVHAE